MHSSNSVVPIPVRAEPAPSVIIEGNIVHKSASLGTLVEVAVQKFRLISIDTVASTFTCVFTLHLRWKNPGGSLPYDIADEAQAKAWFGTWEPDWKPRIEFLNDVCGVKEMRHNYKVDDLGFCRYFGRYRGTFFEKLRLERFPFDRHLLSIKFCSLTLATDCVFSEPLTLYPNTTDRPLVTGWNFYEPPRAAAEDSSGEDVLGWPESLRLSLEDVPFTSAGVPRPFYFHKGTFTVAIERRVGYYLWNIVVPVFCIVVVALCALATDMEDFATRSAILLTVLLTLVAFKFVIASEMPKVGYITALDIYLMVGFLAIIALILWVVVLHSLTQDNIIARNYSSYPSTPSTDDLDGVMVRSNPSKYRPIERIIALVYLAVWLLLHVLGIWCIPRMRRRWTVVDSVHLKSLWR